MSDHYTPETGAAKKTQVIKFKIESTKGSPVDMTKYFRYGNIIKDGLVVEEMTRASLWMRLWWKVKKALSFWKVIQ